MELGVDAGGIVLTLWYIVDFMLYNFFLYLRKKYIYIFIFIFSSRFLYFCLL